MTSPTLPLHSGWGALPALVLTVVAFGTPESVLWMSPDDGSFHDGTNWSTGGPPGPGDSALINAPGTIVVTHSTGATLVGSLDTRERMHVIGSSSLGFSGPATFRELLLLDTAGGLFAQQPATTIDLRGRTAFDAGEIGGLGTVSNRGVMTIAGAGERTISATLVNEGTVNASGPLTLEGCIQNRQGGLYSLIGTTFTTGSAAAVFENNGVVHVAASASAVVGVNMPNDGTIELAQNATLVVQSGGTGIANTGTVQVAAGAMLDLTGSGGNEPAYAQTAGTLDLDGGTLMTGGGTVVVQGGEVVGHGEVEGDVLFDNNMLADPRPSPVCFAIAGDFTQLGGEIVIEFDESAPGEDCGGGGADSGVGGTLVHDVWSVAGTASLGGGTLSVGLPGTLVAPIGATFDVLTAQTVSGSFDLVVMPVLAGARTFQVTYTADAVRLVVIAHPCPGDLDNDGAVGIGDLLAVLAAWGDNFGIPEDIDADSSVGVNDLLTLLAVWGNCQ